MIHTAVKVTAVAVACVTLLSACAQPYAAGSARPASQELTLEQFAQTDFNRTVSVSMRDNLESLSRLLEKLYRRNPAEWRKTGAPDLKAALLQGRKAIQEGRPPPKLTGLRDIEILSVALDPNYRGDRAGAFVAGMASTIINAHNGKTAIYVTDVLNAQHVYNAARNIEIAAWLLSTKRFPDGRPLLLTNEISEAGSNLSFEREFGQLIGRLDLVANLLDENLRRVGINYMQGLLFFNFLPVR
jgi:hypothetical protein